MLETYHRYAIFAAPGTDSPLGRFGNAWLGRDPENGDDLPRPPVPGYSPDEIARLTSEPARYGFHATLKPPFRIAAGIGPDDLLQAAAAFAATRSPVSLSGFEIAAIGKFVAIVPEARNEDLNSLAAACVEHFDPFRAPPTKGETARRLAAGLSAHQERLLARWGYPYVMDCFRFHMTLTGPLTPRRQTEIIEDLSAYASHALGPFRIEDIAVFGEPVPMSRFRLLQRFRLSGRG